MTKRLVTLPVVVISLSSSSAFIVPSPSLVRLRSTSTVSSCREDYFLLSVRHNLRVSQVAHRRAPGRFGLCMMAKKKKGPAADALAQLEALEAAEVVDLETKETGAVMEKRPPPSKKGKKKKGPAADALARLEALEASGVLEVQDAEAKGSPPVEATPIVDERPLPQPLPEASAPQKPKLVESAGAETDGERVLPGPNEAGDAENGNEVLGVYSIQSGGRVKNNKDMDAKIPDELTGEVDAELLMPQTEEAASASLPTVETIDQERQMVKEEETLEAKIRKNRPPPRVRISSTAQPGYVSLRLDGVAVTFRNQEVIKDATWEVKTGDRLGLVGPNGGGKTTQVKVLSGDLQPTAGEVVKSSKDLRVAFLRQEFVDELVMHRSLKEELTSVFKEESEILNELQACEDELQNESVQQDPEQMERVLNHLSKLQDDAESKRVYDLGTKVQRIMDLMGFDVSEGDHPVSSFSGGWRMRIGLGKILLNDPNILLLDEPTNHLDMESVEWLESFLQSQNIPMVIVSHDREFLDRVCTGIVDMDGGVASSYSGNYSTFLKQKQARREAWEAAYRNQQKKIKDERSWINKFKSKGAWASQVKSREKSLEKLITGDDYVKQPPNLGKPFRFRFPPPPRAGSEGILTVSGVSHGYAGRHLFDNVNFTVDKGDRIAFLGPNGAGKSTLLRLVVEQEDPLKGVCTIGSSVVKQYFEQNQADALDLSKTVIETMMEASTTEKYEDLRKLLGQFLFKGDAVEKSVGQLSGGEKARVALCKMMLTPANLLVLDEPTNHLDIPAKEMLEEALQHYEGAVLVVSHDRYFVSQVANTICNFEDNKLIRYDGDYRYFLERNEQILEKVESRYVAGVAGIQKAKRVDKEQLTKPSKTFGGKGGPSGRKDKGIKNAKRHAEKII